MSVDGPGASRLDEACGGLPVLHALQTYWGLAAVLCLGVYSLLHALSYEAPVPMTPVRSLPRQAIVMGGARPLPLAVIYEPLVVHLACNQEDARWARVYDPPASGRSLILRFDQSADEMRALYTGAATQFPKDTRLVTTPCTQAMIENGEFP